jgi:hypothetical protein
VEIAIKLAKQLGLAKPDRYGLVDVVRRSCKCYAGLQETMCAGPRVMPINLTCSTVLSRPNGRGCTMETSTPSRIGRQTLAFTMPRG